MPVGLSSSRRRPVRWCPRRSWCAQRDKDTADTWTLKLRPCAGAPLAFAPGQFTMLSALGSGEVPISISGDPRRRRGMLDHTVRAVGLATEAICRTVPGEVLGVRGPFGRPWPVAEVEGADVVVVAGGIGLAPLRPAILSLLARPRALRRGLLLLYGGRTPDDLLYRASSTSWRARGLEVASRVDSAGPEWLGHVGVVHALIGRARFDAASAVALVVRPRGDDALHGRRARDARRGPRAHLRLDGAQHAVRHRALRALPARADADLPRRARAIATTQLAAAGWR